MMRHMHCMVLLLGQASVMPGMHHVSTPEYVSACTPPSPPPHMQDPGFCHEGDCQRFPVVIGEMGSFLRNPMDLQQLQDMTAYARRQAPTDQPQYQHTPVSGWFW